jgi:exopolysaccharide biosynthesis predicted pyruvyltransferase EpsI
VILLRGGAYLNNLWKGYEAFVSVARRMLKKPKLIIIAPQSFYFNKAKFPSILAGTGIPVHVFCRENASYRPVSSFDYGRNVQLHLSPDPAFYLSTADLNVKERARRIHPHCPRDSIESQ